MSNTQLNHAELKQAAQAALDGDWERSHRIAQAYSDPIANWIHAVLHKIEGDEWNSKYWYAKTASKKYEDFGDATSELIAIQSLLNLDNSYPA
jgi:hypothetical protein